jgi:hypothetical protein
MTRAGLPEPDQSDDGKDQQCDDEQQEEDSEYRVVGMMSKAVHERSLLNMRQPNETRLTGH